MKNFTMIPNDLFERTDISFQARFLYSILSYHCYGDKSYCFPGQKRLAKLMSVSTRSIRYYLEELKEKGLIEIRNDMIEKLEIEIDKKQNLYFVKRNVTLKKQTSTYSSSDIPLSRGNKLPTNNTNPNKKTNKGFSTPKSIFENRKGV